jgi:hypothetical protein
MAFKQSCRVCAIKTPREIERDVNTKKNKSKLDGNQEYNKEF